MYICIYFAGRNDDLEIFKVMIEDTFPSLKDTGGFELIRIAGTTRSRNLTSIPSPDTRYIVRYGQAITYQSSSAIRLLQISIDVEDVSNDSE